MTDPMTSVEPLHRPGKKASGPALSPKAAEFLGKVTVAADFTPHLERRELVKHWLGSTALSVLYGDTNTGKTFFAIDLADHVARDRMWNGCKVCGGPVLYIAAEGGKGFGKVRTTQLLSGWCRGRTTPPPLKGGGGICPSSPQHTDRRTRCPAPTGNERKEP